MKVYSICIANARTYFMSSRRTLLQLEEIQHAAPPIPVDIAIPLTPDSVVVRTAPRGDDADAN